MGMKYGFPAEDIITGLSIQCRGWKSIYFNPERKSFTGVAPTTLLQALVQQKRWSEGPFQLFLSRYCPLIYGRGKIPLNLRMCYTIYVLWAPNCLPTLYYVIAPSLFLLGDISLFPEVWMIFNSYLFFIFNDFLLWALHQSSWISSLPLSFHSQLILVLRCTITTLCSDNKLVDSPLRIPPNRRVWLQSCGICYLWWHNPRLVEWTTNVAIQKNNFLLLRLPRNHLQAIRFHQIRICCHCKGVR